SGRLQKQPALPRAPSHRPLIAQRRRMPTRRKSVPIPKWLRLIAISRGFSVKQCEGLTTRLLAICVPINARGLPLTRQLFFSTCRRAPTKRKARCITLEQRESNFSYVSSNAFF